jgi:hypothetical protein
MTKKQATAQPDIANEPVPGAPIADATAAAGTWNDQPNPAEKRIANPENPDAVMRVRYNPDGTVQREADAVPEEDLGPEGMPAVSPDDAPFSTNDIPSGWNRFPTAEEVAWLNTKYPAAFDDAGNPTEPPVEDLTGTFTSFTAASPTVVTADAEDTAALTVGTIVTLEALTGTTEGMAAVNGVVSAVLSVEPTTLDLDLSAVDTTGLTADYLRG